MVGFANKFGIKVTPLVATMQATMLRAAHKTIKGIDFHFKLVQNCALDYLPVSHYVQGKYNPWGWDSPPMACSLMRALSFSSFDSPTQEDLSEALQKWLHSPHRSMQALFLSAIKSNMKDDWVELVARRVKIMIPNIPRHFNYFVACCNFEFHLTGFSSPVKMMAIRSLAHSWATSYRYHESTLLPCVFGCKLMGPLATNSDLHDTMAHYLVCPRLWSTIAACWSAFHYSANQVPRIPPLPSNPVERLCLNASNGDPRVLAIAHIVYHGLKRGHYHIVKQAKSLRDLRRIDQISYDLCQAAVAELGDRQL